MSFQEVKLPVQLIADMYKSVLVHDTPSVKADAPPQDLQFMGNNTRSIAVLLSTSSPVNEASAETVFLLKMLKACNLTLNDIAVIDIAAVKSSFEHFIEDFKPLKVLLFSAEVNGLPISENLHFQVQRIGGCEVIFAPPVQNLLPETAEAVVLKKKLWLVIKNFFQV